MPRSSLLFICPSLVGAGVERRVCSLVRRFSDSQFRVHLGLLRQQGEFLAEMADFDLLFIPPKRSFRIVLFPLLPFYNLYNFLHALYQIKSMLSRRPDVVVTFTLETTLPMYLLTRLGMPKTFCWIISEDSNTAKGIDDTCQFKWLIKGVESILSRAYRSADYVTTVSSSVEHSVVHRYGVDQRKVNTIHNPIELETVKRHSADVLDPEYDRNYILAVGRLVKVKQFDMLIHAFSEVRKTRNVNLLILGDGPEKPKLEQLIRDLSLTQHVHLLGFVDNPWVFMARANLLAVSSKIEGFSNVIVEAMAVGCPVLSTRCGGPEDIIKNGENGVLVEANRAALAAGMAGLLSDPSLCSRLGQSARISCQRYEPQRIAKEFEQMLETLLIKNKCS